MKVADVFVGKTCLKKALLVKTVLLIFYMEVARSGQWSPAVGHILNRKIRQDANSQA